jgi:ATP-dependent DNA helicase RecG
MVLFCSTLEPCAPGARRHPKLGCAERIVNARIKEVWVGIEDPDPDVDRKGIKYLQDNGVNVFMFDQDLQKQIRKANKRFLDQAKQRTSNVKQQTKPVLSQYENPLISTDTTVFSKEAINLYLKKAKINLAPFTEKFWSHFESIGIVSITKKGSVKIIHPTGFGIMLFAENPRDRFPQSVVKAKVRYGKNKPTPYDFDGAMVLTPYAVEEWLKKVLHSKITRDTFERKTITDFPIEPLREAIINALAHRDYSHTGAKIYLDVDDDKIVIKSPGLPIEPISLEDIKHFKAPSLSRNPKITYVFNKMGLMEESEIGMDTFRSMQEEYGLLIPEYTYQAPYLVLTFPRTIASLRTISEDNVLRSLNNEEVMGYNWIKTKGEISKKEYAENFGFDEKKAYRQLSNMRRLKLIADNGEKPNSPNYKYVCLNTN